MTTLVAEAADPLREWDVLDYVKVCMLSDRTEFVSVICICEATFGGWPESIDP